MKIHREGYRFIFLFAAVTALLTVIWTPLFWPGLVLTLWCAWFFRDPERTAPEGKGLIIAPADGKICAIQELPWPKELGAETGKVWRVSIFMNVFNVHVNRIPAPGTITKLAYVPGKFINASFDKASEHNERQLVAMKLDEGGEIAFVQIAGLVARRILCTLTEGQRVEAGERFGLIRFGSRVDVYLPQDLAPNVKVGEITVAGETIIAGGK